jgi:hypothetical protein
MVFEREKVKALAEIEKEIVKLELARENLLHKLSEIREKANRTKIEVFNSIKAGKEKKADKLFDKLRELEIEERSILDQIREKEIEIVNQNSKFKNLYSEVQPPLVDTEYAYILKKAGYKNPKSPEAVSELKNRLQKREELSEELKKTPIPHYNELVKEYEEEIRKAQEAGKKELVADLKYQLEKIVGTLRQEEQSQIAQMRRDILTALKMAPEAKGKYSRSEKLREKLYKTEVTAEAIAEAVGRGLLKSGIVKAAKPLFITLVGILLVIGVFAFLYMFVYLPRQTTLNAWIRAAFNELQEQIGYQSCRFTALLQAQNPDVVCRPPEVVEAYEEILSYTATGPELVVVKQTIPYEINYILQKPKSLAPNIAPVKNLQLKKIEVRNDRNRCVYRWPSEVLCDEPIVEVIPQTESCVSAACELNKNKDKETASVWLKWANDDVIWCKFCEGKSKTRSFYTYFETEYEYTAPGTAKQIVFSTSEILPPSPQVSKVNVGPVSVDIVASNAYIFKANTPTIPALISIKLKNNGDGTAKIKQAVIEQIKDTEAEFIVFNAEDCTENNVENSGSKTTFTFEEGKIILKPKGGYTLVQCKVDLTNIRNSAKLNEVGHLLYTLKPSVSYSYTIRRQVNTAIDQRCELVKLSEPEKEEEICKQFA